MKKKRKPYKSPTIKEKKMTAHFMVCLNSAGGCQPCTKIRQSGKCY